MGGLTSFKLASRFRAVVLMAPAIQRFKHILENILISSIRLLRAV
jgi:hypothetical protein